MDEFALTTSELVGRLTRIVAQEPMTPNARDHVQLAAVRLGVQNTEIDRLRGGSHEPDREEVARRMFELGGFFWERALGDERSEFLAMADEAIDEIRRGGF